MLTTRQKVLRRFWYATEKLENLEDGPKAFTLLGEKLVLFVDGEGEPAALMDRCCHRTAKLSKGWCEGGLIRCGYHGWSYDRTGALIEIPQCDILDSTDPDATMDMSRKIELHMPSDRPGMLMRKRILKLLRDNGEDEISEAAPAVSWPLGPVVTRHEELA